MRSSAVASGPFPLAESPPLARSACGPIYRAHCKARPSRSRGHCGQPPFRQAPTHREDTAWRREERCDSRPTGPSGLDRPSRCVRRHFRHRYLFACSADSTRYFRYSAADGEGNDNCVRQPNNLDLAREGTRTPTSTTRTVSFCSMHARRSQARSSSFDERRMGTGTSSCYSIPDRNRW